MGAHWTQILILAGVALLFFGPKRLPEMGSAIGKTVREFQRSMHEIAHEEPRASAVEAVAVGEAVEPAPPTGMIAAAETAPTSRARMEDAREDAAATSTPEVG